MTRTVRARARSAARTQRSSGAARLVSPDELLDHVRAFRTPTGPPAEGETLGVPTFVGEFWTARQRQGHSLHEVSYRACFKAELPGFFVERLTAPGDLVYDPFMGRGTTPLEAALRGRAPGGNDVNPLARVLLEPRLAPPTVEEVEARLAEVDLGWPLPADPLEEDLLVFFHPETLRELRALRAYLRAREERGQLDGIDRWLRMVALGRLTGHSQGFFSVYTLPPNQAVSAAAQRQINARRGQQPEPRAIAPRILRKTRALLRDLGPAERAALAEAGARARLSTGPADRTAGLADGSVDLVVTSPPFLDVVDYAADNWLRCWFCGIDPSAVELTVPSSLAAWSAAMTDVLRELHRAVRPGGVVAFEVGEVRGGEVRLEEAVLPAARAAGFTPLLVMINDQEFTKTANCWGVRNREKGTNTNRICVLVR